MSLTQWQSRKALAVALCVITTGAQADNVYQFQANFTDFSSLLGRVPLAPYSPVNLGVVFSSPGPGLSATQLLDVQLTIGPKTFATSEIGFIANYLPGLDLIGANINGTESVQLGTYDFYFVYDPTNFSDFSFVYSVFSSSFSFTDSWISETTSSLSITPIPEPSTYWLMFFGLVSLLLPRMPLTHLLSQKSAA